MARLLTAAMLLLGLLAAAAWAAAGDTVLVSRSSAGDHGDGASSEAAISADGRFVAFQSNATNLHPDDAAPDTDVFVHSLQTGTTTLVSRGTGPSTSRAPAISADGRFVAFESDAADLDPDDTDALFDVFRHDLQSGTTELVSRVTGPDGASADDHAQVPAISTDGTVVAFASGAANLQAGGILQVFVRDLGDSTTTLASQASGDAGVAGDNTSYFPAISGDGRFVAFESFADNLHGGDADDVNDVFVRDLEMETTSLVSEGGNRSSSLPAISADGRYVAFASGSSTLDPDDTDTIVDVFVRDRQAASTTLVSAKGNGLSNLPSISADGRYVAFDSFASNLDADDPDGFRDVFVRDVQEATTTLVSRATGPEGAKGVGNSTGPAISDDARLVAFHSGAANLHPDDGDEGFDVFVRELGAPEPPPGPPPPGSPPPTGSPPAEPGTSPAPPAGAAQVPPPVAGRSEVLEPVSGIVRVRRRGTRRFVRLRTGRLLPDGSEVDATRGVVRIVVAAVRDGSETSSVLLSEGRAVIDQNRARRPTTTLRLSAPLSCRAAGAATASGPKRKRRRKRSIFAETDGGRFRTRGNHAAATASGTAWRTSDRCESTRIDVREGTVRVRDRVRRRTVVVRAPDSYTARKRVARRPARRG